MNSARNTRMSCWVVPSLAAEIWRIPLTEVMRRIEEGQLAVREEDGFTFVDVAPDGPRISRPSLPPHQRPATFMPVEVDDESEDGPLDVEETSAPMGDWRAARTRAGRTRIAPRRLTAA